MKTLNENQKWNAGLNLQLQEANSKPRPRIGDDDGISDRAMNFLIVLFTLLTVGVSIAGATPNDDVKYRIMLRQAMLDIDRTDYDKAIIKLLEVRANTEETALVNHLLGKCYLYGEVSSEKAVFYLNLANADTSVDFEEWDLDETKAPLQNTLMLAKAYEKTEHFDMAAEFYAQFLKNVGEEGLDPSSRTYALIGRKVEECQYAAIQQGNVLIDENLVYNQKQ